MWHAGAFWFETGKTTRKGPIDGPRSTPTRQNAEAAVTLGRRET
jgi:hypothetical protein